MSKHAPDSCPRCSEIFTCKVNAVLQCDCQKISLNYEETQYIREITTWDYDGACLCLTCLQELKNRTQIKMLNFDITATDKSRSAAIQHTLDFKTKPVGSLGVLEQIAFQLALIQETLTLQLNKPTIVIFAGDHGIAKEGVSNYPAEVTPQMVLNFVAGGAAINVLCRQHQLDLHVVDAGVNVDFDPELPLVHQKIAKGTRSYLNESAMSLDQAKEAIQKGAAFAKSLIEQGSNVLGFGEMGIGNTSSASVLMSQLCQIPLAECVGKGTGLNDEQVQHKIDILTQALEKHDNISTPLELLATFGGFEIAQMVGAMLETAANKCTILVDGFICTSAFLVAHALYPDIIDYAIFCHQSDESGHKKMLDVLNAKAILHMNLRLGEGTGCALAFPMIQSAALLMNQMASFESAGVSTSSK